MKNLLKLFGGVFVVLLVSSAAAFAQHNPLTHPSNYKTHPAGLQASARSEGNGVLTETTEAVNYKRSHLKRKTRKVSLETSSSARRNYKMGYNR